MKMVHFYQRIELVAKNGTKYKMISVHWQPYTGQLDTTVNYSNDDTPSTTDFVLHGLTKEHAALFEKDCQIDLYAGYWNIDFTENRIGHVVHSTITTVQPYKNDAGDWQLSCTSQDGKKYDAIKEIKVKDSKKVRVVASQKSLESKISAYNSKMNKQFNLWRDEHPKATKKQISTKRKEYTTAKTKKRTELSSAWNKQRKYLNTHKKYQIKTEYKAMSFKAGTSGSTIITKIAKAAGIDIQTLKLVYDRKFLNGYVAKKKPMNCIKEIAADCETPIFYSHGYLVIKDFVSQTKLDYTATKTTGLLAAPEYQEDSDSGKTWQVELLYNPQITTGSVFYIKDDALTGWVIVLSGTSSYSAGSVPTTEVTVQMYADYKKQQATAVKKKKTADKKAKDAKDKKERDAAKKKQKQRTKSKKSKESKNDKSKDSKSKSTTTKSTKSKE